MEQQKGVGDLNERARKAVAYIKSPAYFRDKVLVEIYDILVSGSKTAYLDKDGKIYDSFSSGAKLIASLELDEKLPTFDVFVQKYNESLELLERDTRMEKQAIYYTPMGCIPKKAVKELYDV